MKKQNLLLITVVSSLGGLLFGYDTGVINGTQFYFSKYFELEAMMKGWVVSSALVGCFVGALFSGLIRKAVPPENTPNMIISNIFRLSPKRLGHY